VFSLTQWSAQIHTGFHVLRATQVPPEFDWVLTYGAVTLYGGSFQNSSVNLLDLLFSPSIEHLAPSTEISLSP